MATSAIADTARLCLSCTRDNPFAVRATAPRPTAASFSGPGSIASVCKPKANPEALPATSPALPGKNCDPIINPEDTAIPRPPPRDPDILALADLSLSLLRVLLKSSFVG